jgi:hypothetical protein
MKTEDIVREQAGKVLGFDDTETAKSGVGQLTSFNSLDFKGVKDRPDGWYLPNETIFPAIILEAKAESLQLKQVHIDELFKNLKIVETKYREGQLHFPFLKYHSAMIYLSTIFLMIQGSIKWLLPSLLAIDRYVEN